MQDRRKVVKSVGSGNVVGNICSPFRIGLRYLLKLWGRSPPRGPLPPVLTVLECTTICYYIVGRWNVQFCQDGSALSRLLEWWQYKTNHYSISFWHTFDKTGRFAMKRRIRMTQKMEIHQVIVLSYCLQSYFPTTTWKVGWWILF